MQDVPTCRNASLDASWWPHSKSWEVFPWVPHAALLAAWCHGHASACILSLCHPAVGYFCSPPHLCLTYVLVSWSVRQAFLWDMILPWDTGCGNGELYATIWIWHRCASGCCDRCGTAWCPAPTGQQSSALANAHGRSTGACWWHAALSWNPAKSAVVVPAGGMLLSAKFRLNGPLLYQAACDTVNILLINYKFGWRR